MSKRRLPILIGSNEAQYIGIVMERLNTKRPMTHDLLFATIEALGGKVVYVYIHDMKQEIFISEVVVQHPNNQSLVHIDARASDAIALATKTGVPIYTNDYILNQSSFLNEIYVTESNKTSFNDYTVSELEALLVKVIEKEDYESAIRIRECIQRKKSN
jgi:bifunctional DNase/RNase